jgi:hypothetical protein
MNDLVNARRDSGEHTDKGLKQRFQQMLKGTNFRDRGHLMQFEQRQQQLNKLINTWNDKDCGDPPEDYLNWVNVRLPGEILEQIENRTKRNQLFLDLTMSGAAAYGAYRIVRLIPSLFPAFWPTLPPNLAIP